MGLETLEYWQENIEPDVLEPVLMKIIPSLDSFLRSKSLKGVGQAHAEKRRKTLQPLKKRKVLLELEPELVMLQRKILCFIGKQSLTNLHAFIFSDGTYVPNLVSGRDSHLKVTLPYEDLQLDIYLDSFLPRIIDLALLSSDRKTRITACELLQACVMVFLGRAKPMSQSGLTDLNNMLKIMAMPLLQLGCDIDQVVQQIFQPLFLQLVHWYTSPTQARGAHTSILIDTLMEGITHPTNSSLRDFSGKCVNEFVRWTIKQSNDNNLVRDPINIKILVKNMRFFSSHPDSAKKLGAALIFNNIYKEIREEESLISIFWLEILHIFVLSLSAIPSFVESGTVVQIKHALSHVQRVFVEKPAVFRKADERRRVPNDFQSGSLKDVAVWVVQQTASMSKHCRDVCMDLFVNIAPLASEKKMNLQNFLSKNLEHPVSHLYNSLACKFEKLKDNCAEGSTVLLKWLHKLLCAVDGYNFIVRNNFESIDLENNMVFEEMLYFLENFQSVDIADALNLIARKTWVFTVMDRDQFGLLKSACCLSILKLYNYLLHDEYCEKSSSLWCFLDLKEVLHPDYSELLTILLNSLPRKLGASKLAEFKGLVTTFIDNDFNTSLDLGKSVTLKQRNILKGMILLSSVNFGQVVQVESYANGIVDKLIEVFSQDANKEEGIIFINEIQDTTYTYIVSLLRFSLNNNDEFESLVSHLHAESNVQSVEFTREMSFGSYFLNTFTEATTPVMLKNFNTFLALSLAKGDLKKTVELVTSFLILLIKEKRFKYHFQDVAQILMDKWHCFVVYFDADKENVSVGLEFLKVVVEMCKSHCEQVGEWLVKCLMNSDSTNYLEVFNLLVLITADEDTEQQSNDLKSALMILGEQLESSNSLTNTISFDKILTAIPLVKSCTIFEFLVRRYLSIPTSIDISYLLVGFIKSIDESVQRKTLDIVYSMSYDTCMLFEHRYKLTTEVMPLIFQNSSLSVFEQFYVENIEGILEKLEESDLEIAMAHFILIELLFLRIPIGSKDREACPITKASKKPKLLPVLLKFALDAFKMPSETSELVRKFKCHAYNALASMTSNSLKKNDFYEKLFVRQIDSNDVLWKGIINTEVDYDFPVVFATIPDQRKVLLSIRDELRQHRHKDETRTKSLKYIESQRLFNSSLSEDITNYDFTNSILRSGKRVTEDSQEILVVQNMIHLDATEINSHECMATVCGLIQHIFDTGVNELPAEGDEDVVLPNWMNGLRETLLNENTHRNVKIFLVKVIENMPEIFGHYSKWFLEPLMQFVVQKCAGDGINYFVTDVLVILSKWSTLLSDLSENEKLLATELIDFLLKNLTRERLDVFKFNLDILKMIVESWKTFLEVPTSKVLGLISSDSSWEIGIHVSSVLLANHLSPWEEGSESSFLDLLLKRLGSDSKSAYKPCSETIGLMLHILNDGRYTETVDSSLKKISDCEKYVLCLEGIAVHFPQIIKPYHISRLISPLNQVPDAQKIVHLRIIFKRVENSLDILGELSDFKIVEWDQLLEHSNLEIQIISLEIIKKCLEIFITYDNFRFIVKTLTRNVSNPNALYRSCLYDIAMQVYNHKKDNTGACKDILIFGLIDADGDNREKVTKFWAENTSLPNTVIQRFPFLLSEIYKSRIEDKFMGFVTYFLIYLLSQGENYEDEVFEHPLEDCDFEDYRLQTNWRLQHPSVVPMFAETLQTYDTSNEMQDDTYPFQLRQTQSTFDFAPTQSFQEQQLSKYTSLETSLAIGGDIKNPNTLILSQKYRMPRRRFLKDKDKISRIFAHFETKKQVKKVQERIDSAKEREKKVTIYRKYRKGDFPDIQIVLSSILKPLQMLALHDTEISKILFLEIFKGLTSKVENDQAFLETVSTSIKHIFNSSTQFNPNLFSALLDILLKNKKNIPFEPQLISYVALESGLVSTGALLLEEYIISLDDLPGGSKRGVGQESGETLYWVKLAELYKELQEWDTVRAIFIEKMQCNEIVHRAIKYESKLMYRPAQDLYKHLIDTDLSPDRKDFYYESYFKCFAEMGEWEELPTAIVSIVEGENKWDCLWDNGWYQQKLLPWYVRAQVKNDLFSQVWDVEFMKDINRCLTDSEKNEHLRSNFSEELFLMWLGNKEIPTANVYLKSCIRYFLEDWQLINPMFQSLRFQKLLNLQNVIEAADFIATYTKLTDDPELCLKKLTDRWEQSKNDILPSVLLNETRLLYRTQFISLLTEKISTIEGIDLREHKKNLQISKVKMDIDFINIAADFNNYYFARKYYKKYKGRENVKLNMAFANVALAKTKLAENLQDQINKKLFDVYSKLSQTFAKNPDLFEDNKKYLEKTLKKQVTSPSDIENCAMELLKNSISKIDEDMDCDNFENRTKHKEMAGAYVKLANFIRDRGDDNMQGDFISFVLRAMKMNSSEARQLFPCTLMQSGLGSTYKEIFLEESENIPTWMFLGWIPQLLANVDSPKVFAISKIIKRIAETYPQAIMYPYRLSRENYKFTDENIVAEAKVLTDRLDELLLENATVNKFLKALSYVSMPVGILIYHLAKILKCGSLEAMKNIQDSVRDSLFADSCGSSNINNMQGNMFKKIQHIKNEFSKTSGTFAKQKENWKKIYDSLKALLGKRDQRPSLVLKDYCPWLANFSANRLNMELEIPGQYDGKKMPLPQHHVKVSGFHPNVKPMDSLRRPIKITMLGMDTKEYPFLVKFGEDIRQDQRIEQLFGLMNDIFKSDTACSNNGLEILTYQVIPLTSNLGIIQWINDTEPLGDFIQKSLQEKKALEKIPDEYNRWLSKGNGYMHIYGKTATKMNRNKTIAFYRSLVHKIPWDTLRSSFLSLSTNTENYIALRTNFIKTYAVLCASHWLLGIGDRHLKNSLVCLGNGKVLGIDFGHAYGTATQILPVPELVPFRLTPHIVSLMEPLKERGQFRECLIHCLKSLRDNGVSLLATMNVFIEEPSLDWLEHAVTFDDSDQTAHQPEWYPNIKINQAKRKLRGASSTKIMVEDLVANKSVEQQYKEVYTRLVKGEREHDVRAKFTESESLSVEEQVDCLIDHATDFNLLGRMYSGWAPWV
ncbi:hypothetical protein JTB14_011622 [Gonioctena quinquepunctata]|nr:hypothetical protein JTB14_011622 [Gonioctena quinquepunctata]